MKKLLMLLAVVLALTFTSVAQIGYSSGTDSDQASAGKSKAKTATVTGCISAQADASGNYTLTNGHYKKGVKIGPADKVSAHAGHTAQLTGQWSGSGADKSFEVASVKHLSATCTAEKATAKKEKAPKS